jgi:tetratricopeptide (TPR) repeat protein
MKSVKVTKRKGLQEARVFPRRAGKRGASRQVASGQGLSARKGRRNKTGSRRVHRDLQVTARRTAETNNGDTQLPAAVRQFEAAVRYFQKENYNGAKEILERLADTAPPEVADRARIHLRLCERRSFSAPTPKTAADNYLFGVAELNAGRADAAADYLQKAHKLEPKREDVCYALAASYALQGKAEAALELLKAAIALRPQNRFQARQDPDFQPLGKDPRFLQLVHSGSSQGLQTAVQPS